MARMRRRRFGFRRRKRNVEWLDGNNMDGSIVLNVESDNSSQTIVSGGTELSRFDGDLTIERTLGECRFQRLGTAAANVVLKVCIGFRLGTLGETMAINPAIFVGDDWYVYVCCILDFNDTSAGSPTKGCTVKIDSKARRKIHQPQSKILRVHVGLLDIGTAAYVTATHGNVVASWISRTLVRLPS